MGLMDYYNKAKKKLSDIAGGIGGAFNAAKSAVGNYFGNDQTYGGKVKNEFMAVPAATKQTFGVMGDTFNHPSNIGDSLAKTDYFKPVPIADNKPVRIRDFSRELPGAVLSTGKDMFSGTVNVATKAPKILGEGLAYAIDPNVRKQYEAGNTDILPTVASTTPTSMLADTGRSMLEVGTAGKSPKWAASPSLIKRTAQGLGIGYGFDVLGNVSNDGNVSGKDFIPGVATVMGGAFGAAAKPTAQLAKASAEEIAAGAKKTKEIAGLIPDAAKNSFENRFGTPKTETIPAHYVDAPGSAHDVNDGFPLINKLIPDQTVTHKASPTLSDVGTMMREALPRPGLNIEDISGGKPSVIPKPADVIAMKNERARQIVGNQVALQRNGAQVAEPGFISPESVKAPKNAKIELMPSTPKTVFTSPQIRPLTQQENGSLQSINSVLKGESKQANIANVPGFISQDGKSRPLILDGSIVNNKIIPKHGNIIPENLSINANDWDGALKNVRSFENGVLGSPNPDKINLIKKIPGSDNVLLIGADRQNGFFVLTHYEIKPINGNEIKSLLGRGDLISPDGTPLGPKDFLGAPSAQGSFEGVSGRIDTSSVAPKTQEVKAPEPNDVGFGINLSEGELAAIGLTGKEKVHVPAQIPEELFNSEGGSNLLTELEVAQAGSRHIIDTGIDRQVIAQSSSFPKWVPEELRSRKLFDKVEQAITNGNIPETPKARALYDVIHNELRTRAGLPEADSFVMPEKPVSAFDKFVSELDSIQAPWDEKKATETAQNFGFQDKPVLYSDMPSNIRAIKENVDNGILVGPKNFAKLRQWEEQQQRRSSEPFMPNQGPFNKYQKAAFDAKQGRIGDIGKVMSAPRTLTAMGYKKAEIARMGIADAEQISAMGKLGHTKDEIKGMDIDRRNLVINNRVQAESLRQFYKRKHELDTKFLDGVDPKTLSDISPFQTGTRDLYRNFETVFGGKYNDPMFQKIKQNLLDPFDAAKGAFVDEQRSVLADLKKNVVDGLGIKKGSDLSAAVQLFGEKKITLEQLKEQFPKDWEKVVKAESWFRNSYDTMLTDLNRIREYYYPTHPLYPETTKQIPARQNYFRHFQEMTDGFQGLANIFDSPANIDPSLALSSEFTKPKTKWLSFAQQRKGDQTTYDAVGGFLDYLKANAYAKHIDPFIQMFRGADAELKSKADPKSYLHTTTGLAEELTNKVDPMQQIADMTSSAKIKNFLVEKGLQDRDALRMAKDLSGIKDAIGVKEYLAQNLTPEGMNEFNAKAPAEDSANKLNNFLTFLDDFANDLSGKTNPADRWAQKRLGRTKFKAINWVNSRVKANTILGNVSSTLSQLFNIPQGVADAGVFNSTKAIGDSLAGIFMKDTPMSQSSFIKERYFDDYSNFDTGIINNTKNFAAWMTSVGDEIGTKYVWNAEYRKALEVGAADPVKYADDWTRRMVAGRGIGEVPIDQKAKLVQLFMPFQLEVANQWRVFGDWAKNDPTKLAMAKKLIIFSVASFLMNAAKRSITGSDTSFDPLNALIEGIGEYQKEKNPVTGALKATGRMAGEFASNIPGGQQVASIYPEYGAKDVFGTGLNLPLRKDFFGNGDPTRLGGGLIASKSLTDPIYSLMPPFGGQQVKKTLGGIGALAQGYSTSGTGNVVTPVTPDATNVMKGVLFGKNALSEVQDAHANNQTPLSADQTEKFKMLGNDKGYFDNVMSGRAADKEKKAIMDGKTPSSGMPISGPISEGITPLSDGTFFVKSIGKNGKTFDTPEEASLEIAKDGFMKSDKNLMEYNGTVFRKYRDATGNIAVSTMAKDEYTSKMNSAQLAGFKSSDNYKGWIDTAQKQFEILNARLNDPMTDDLDRMTIQHDIETLVGEYAKFSEYGGFKKPKAVSEKYKYPIVDPEWNRIQSLIAGTTGTKFRMTPKILPLVMRRAPAVHRRSVYKK